MSNLKLCFRLNHQAKSFVPFGECFAVGDYIYICCIIWGGNPRFRCKLLQNVQVFDFTFIIAAPFPANHAAISISCGSRAELKNMKLILIFRRCFVNLGMTIADRSIDQLWKFFDKCESIIPTHLGGSGGALSQYTIGIHWVACMGMRVIHGNTSTSSENGQSEIVHDLKIFKKRG